MLIKRTMHVPENHEKCSKITLEGSQQTTQMNSNYGPHPLFLGITQTSRSPYRSSQYPFDAPLASSELAQYDLHHSMTHFKNGPLPSNGHFFTSNKGTHTSGTLLCQNFTYANDFLFKTILCLQWFACVQEHLQNELQHDVTCNSSTGM